MNFPSSTVVLLALLQFYGTEGGGSCSCMCSSRDSGNSGSISIPTSRVFGGSNSVGGSRPFQVGLRFDASRFCGGAIYNSQTILTAAHCVANKATSSICVFVGSLLSPNRLFAENAPCLTPVKVTSHPKFKDPYKGYDICVIKLGNPIQYNSSIQPIPVVEPGIDLTGKVATTSGWGGTGDFYMMDPDYLKQGVGRIMSRKECENKLLNIGGTARARLPVSGIPVKVPLGAGGEPLYKSLCILGGGVGGSVVGEGSCSGDSGGPVTCEVGGSTKLCAIVAAGYRCGDDLPQVHTEVNDPDIFKWILDNAGEPDTPTINY